MRHDTPCHVEPLEPDPEPEALQAAEILFLAVAGMGCPNCANRVRNALLRSPGVVNAEVDHRASVAEVWVDAERLEPEPLCAAVARAGEGTHHEYVAVPIPRRDSGE